MSYQFSQELWFMIVSYTDKEYYLTILDYANLVYLDYVYLDNMLLSYRD